MANCKVRRLGEVVPVQVRMQWLQLRAFAWAFESVVVVTKE